MDYENAVASSTVAAVVGLTVLFGWTRVCMDIMQAYLIGRAEPNQQYPVRYPAGKYREQYRDPDTGEERYALITGNLYGLPTSARVFSQERDRLLLEEMPRRYGVMEYGRMGF